MNVQAPIATDKDRSAIAHLVSRMRPDWDTHGNTVALAKHPDQSLDVLALQAIIAAVTRTDQKTPAILGLDGDHTQRARVALSKPQVTPRPLTTAEYGGECGYPGCGLWEAMHKGARIPSEIPLHDWEQPRPRVPASAEAIAAARPTFHRHEETA